MLCKDAQLVSSIAQRNRVKLRLVMLAPTTTILFNAVHISVELPVDMFGNYRNYYYQMDVDVQATTIRQGNIYSRARNEHPNERVIIIKKRV